MTLRLISRPELRERKGIRWSRQHLDRLVKAGKFPKPLELGVNTRAWLEDEVDGWIAERAAERDDDA
jgi:prophage regulatory protein